LVAWGTPAGYRGEGLIQNFWRMVAHYGVSFFSGVPTVYSALLNVGIGQSQIDSLKFAICGAAPMPVETFRNFEKKTGVRILEGYGCTEGACASSVNPAYGERRVGSVGFPFPYQEMKTAILTETGAFERWAETDEIGSVVIRGHNVFPGYKQAQQNETIWVDTDDGQGPFYHTGDLGRLDAEGYLWLTGRQKELIIRGGHNLDPKLIEDPLTTHPAVEMVAAVGRPDARVGEMPVAYVKLKAGARATKEELMSYAQEHITERAAIPKWIHLVDDLPLTNIGKIFKPALVYQEVAAAYRQALQELSSVEQVEVEVGPDKLHGTLAQIGLRPKEGADRDTLHRQADHILGAYAVPYQLEIQ
jgi:fatty-acyl-CoA synthase